MAIRIEFDPFLAVTHIVTGKRPDNPATTRLSTKPCIRTIDTETKAHILSLGAPYAGKLLELQDLREKRSQPTPRSPKRSRKWIGWHARRCLPRTPRATPRGRPSGCNRHASSGSTNDQYRQDCLTSRSSTSRARLIRRAIGGDSRRQAVAACVVALRPLRERCGLTLSSRSACARRCRG